jgi:hypothetical protein
VRAYPQLPSFSLESRAAVRNGKGQWPLTATALLMVGIAVLGILNSREPMVGIAVLGKLESKGVFVLIFYYYFRLIFRDLKAE